MSVRSVRWMLACWGTACLLLVAPLVDRARHPDSPLLYPPTFNDALLYRVILEKAAPGEPGDPFLWEHRHSSRSMLNLVRLWPVAYGQLYHHGGDAALLALSTLLSGLWFFALFLCARRLGLPPPVAFFVAGVQCFFVVNFAYQVVGFKTNFRAWSFWITEHMRLYPTVTAMAWYGVAAALVAWAFTAGRAWRLVLAGLAVALTAYGRPFDWMVLLGALGILFLLGIAWRRRVDARRAAVILAVALACSAGFIAEFTAFMKAFLPAYEDQIARGNLQVKQVNHYLKYSLVAFPLILAAAASLRWLKVREGLDRDDGPSHAFLWLASLAVASLLVHYKSLAEGGITLVGFAYPMIFSVFPWFFLLFSVVVCRGIALREAAWLRRREWVTLLVGLVALQQLGILARLRDQCPGFVVPSGRMAAYRQIRQQGGTDAVVLTLGRGLEVSAFAQGRLFLPNPVVVTYVCAAPTAELLERFCVAKLLLSGTLEDLKPVFARDGLLHFDAWVAAQPPATRFWVSLLEETLGHNTFVFHPFRNRGELAHRGIRLPVGLQAQEELVVWFPPELSAVFERWSSPSLPPDMFAIFGKLRLNFVYVPSAALSDVDLARLDRHPMLRAQPLPSGSDGRLWHVVSAEPRGN